MFNTSRHDRWVFGDRDSGAYLRQVRLDEDRPAPDGHGHGVTRRPRPGPSTGPQRRRKAHATRWAARPRCCFAPAGTLPRLRDAPAARRPRTTNPARMGTVDHGPCTKALRKTRHRPDDGSSGDDHDHAPHPRPLPTTPNRHGNGDQRDHDTDAHRDLLEPDAVKVARPVLRGPRRSNGPGYPTNYLTRLSDRAAFDDPNLVSTAGLVPVMALAEPAGCGIWPMST